MSQQWFFHDGLNDHVEYFDTEKEAMDAAKESISWIDAGEGWPQELLDGGIKIGLVLFESTKGDERDTDNPDWDFECDVEMAEVGCSRIEELQREILALKEELKRERSCVDEVERQELDEEYPSTRISKMAKLARQTQAQRKIEL